MSQLKTVESEDRSHEYQHDDQNKHGVIRRMWCRCTNRMRNFLLRIVVDISVISAKHPIVCITFVVLLSFALITAGYLTNFSLNVDTNMLFTPTGSRTLSHQRWLNENLETGGDTSGILTIMIHADGANVLHKEGMERLFQVIDTLQAIPDYDTTCQAGSYKFNGVNTCKISSATRFWGHNITKFESSVSYDLDVIKTISESEYFDGVPVDHGSIMFGATKSKENGTYQYASVFNTLVFFPYNKIPLEELIVFERTVSDALIQIRDEWAAENGNNIKLEIFCRTSYEDEFMRAIANDLPLMPLVFVIMVAFTCSVFFKRDRIHSRCLLGLGGVISVVLSIVSGYGLLFLLGVPLTPMTNVLPFLVFGIGLDDAFIIVGEYNRQQRLVDPVKRIRETMEACGLSILTTTVTTSFAFVLGLISSLPVIRWLCLYAFPMIIIVFTYQITFFVALIVLDERRIQANRQDCCTCFGARIVDDPNDNGVPEKVHVSDRFMSWYAEKLLNPRVKGCVILLFLAYLGGCAYSMTLMQQDFQYQEMVPSDSYIIDFAETLNRFSSRSLMSFIYFRDVEQSDPEVQNQMIDYVDELSSLEEFGAEPPFCWVRDFQKYQYLLNDGTGEELSFNEKVDKLLEIPYIREVYGDQIIRDDQGNIITSRCIIFMENVDMSDVDSQVSALREQRRVSSIQPINQGRKDWAFFSYDVMYLVWEFYNSAVEELISTTISAIVAVALVAIFLIPNWTAVFFVLPMICILYIDLVGTIQFVGVKLNVISYISLVISIGLMVDFIMHIILRYYESTGLTREDKVRDALRTMGSSILVGGLSTVLSTVPLLFSSSAILGTIFDAFFSMVMLSLAHGLIFLPVILSIIGPTDTNNNHHVENINLQLDRKSTDPDADSRGSDDSKGASDEEHGED